MKLKVPRRRAKRPSSVRSVFTLLVISVILETHRMYHDHPATTAFLSIVVVSDAPALSTETRQEPPKPKIVPLRKRETQKERAHEDVVQQNTTTPNKKQKSTHHREAEGRNESYISSFRIPYNHITESYNTENRTFPFTCIPNVMRANGTIEYISNTVKSWYLVFQEQNLVPPPLIVYNMDQHTSLPNETTSSLVADPTVPHWTSRLYSDDGNVASDGDDSSFTTTTTSTLVRHPSWLEANATLDFQLQAARKQTYGDSASRVRWRSTEAQHYGHVLRACADKAAIAHSQQGSSANDDLVLILQDDVIFAPSFPNAYDWAHKTLLPKNNSKRRKKYCTATLYKQGLVARYYRWEDIESFSSYVLDHFDDAPVDFLLDEWCKEKKATKAVMTPNPVRHRGLSSSFSENVRANTIT